MAYCKLNRKCWSCWSSLLSSLVCECFCWLWVLIPMLWLVVTPSSSLFTHNNTDLSFPPCSPDSSRLSHRTGSLQVFPHDVLWGQSPVRCNMVVEGLAHWLLRISFSFISWFKYALLCLLCLWVLSVNEITQFISKSTNAAEKNVIFNCKPVRTKTLMWC